MPYVICTPQDAEHSSLDAKSLANRAFHPDEATENKMEIDKMYYLAQQVCILSFTFSRTLPSHCKQS